MILGLHPSSQHTLKPPTRREHIDMGLKARIFEGENIAETLNPSKSSLRLAFFVFVNIRSASASLKFWSKMRES